MKEEDLHQEVCLGLLVGAGLSPVHSFVLCGFCLIGFSASRRRLG